MKLNKQDLDLKKWCIERAIQRSIIDQNGNSIQPDIIKEAQKIYDWIKK